ncbi:hypothetical protein EVAR_59307_1 [Eumeta japonica]|uniref:Uncharacterized protein n=1 Tax=Eumeta variegata TaxID=151549 RepID=A0A4C1YAW0_EUMVA|nr:hypothetical protein EVAR_59307_1 [Eumeta japonica]
MLCQMNGRNVHVRYGAARPLSETNNPVKQMRLLSERIRLGLIEVNTAVVPVISPSEAESSTEAPASPRAASKANELSITKPLEKKAKTHSKKYPNNGQLYLDGRKSGYKKI